MTAAATLSAILAPRFAAATTYVFDPGLSSTSGTDGDGTWNTTSGNWFNNASGAINPQVWSNLPTDTALFGAGGAGGTVSVGTVTVGTLQFNSTSGTPYTLTGGTINLSGAGTTLSAPVVSGGVAAMPTINSVLAGTAALNTSNGNPAVSSVVTLGGPNTYTGPTLILGNITLSVSSIANGGSASGIGQSSSDPGNLVLFATIGQSNTAANPGSGATLLYTGATQTTDRGLTLAGAQQDNFNVSNPSTVLTFAGQVLARANNTQRVVKQGPGTLAFTYGGTNTFSNGNSLNVDSGTLVLGAPGQVDSVPNSGLIIGNAVSPAGTAAAPNSAVLNVIGGTVNIAVNLGFGTGDLAGNQLLTANVTGGVVNATGGVTFAISGSAASPTTGVLNVSGAGIINATGATTGLFAGAATANSVSVLNLSGSAAVNTNGSGTSYVAPAGIGTVNQTGGTFTLVGPLGVGGTAATGVGTYNLAGGTLTAPAVTAGLGNSTFNFNGGTLRASNNSAGFMTGLSAANVQAGGAVIDTQAFNVTVAQPLLAGGAAGGTAGGLTKLGTGSLTLSGGNTYAGPTNVANGTLVVATSVALPTLADVTVSAGATLALAPHGSAAPVVPVLNTVTLGSAAGPVAGRFDLADDAAVLRGTSLATATADAAAGYAGGTRAGPAGFVTSLAPADATRLLTVGVIQNNQGGTPLYSAANPFAGAVAPAPADVLVRATYFGDANLDGVVDGQDYARLDAGFASGGTLTGWYDGDFNYDGNVDGSDYTLIDNAFDLQRRPTSSAAAVAAPTAEVAAVPEPAAAVAAGAASAAACLRRRRRHR